MMGRLCAWTLEFSFPLTFSELKLLLNLNHGLTKSIYYVRSLLAKANCPSSKFSLFSPYFPLQISGPDVYISPASPAQVVRQCVQTSTPKLKRLDPGIIGEG